MRVDGSQSDRPTCAMPTYTPPTEDAIAQAAVRVYEVLDTPPEDAFDDLIQIAADATGATAAALVFRSGDEHFCKARTGSLPAGWPTFDPPPSWAGRVPIR